MPSMCGRGPEAIPMQATFLVQNLGLFAAEWVFVLAISLETDLGFECFSPVGYSMLDCCWSQGFLACYFYFCFGAWPVAVLLLLLAVPVAAGCLRRALLFRWFFSFGLDAAGSQSLFVAILVVFCS
ncbi:hypothetical protein U1Q18_042559 [Sarracenia purpurea var. burkii]